MQTSDEDDLWTSDDRRLTPTEWARLRQLGIARGHEARGQAVRALAGTAIAALQAAAKRVRDALRSVVGRAVAAVTLWWERRQAVQELSRLDDRSLRDIGLNRADIEFVIYDTIGPAARRISVPRPHRPRARSKAARPGAKPGIDRAAA